jgi:hypothetical protein
MCQQANFGVYDGLPALLDRVSRDFNVREIERAPKVIRHCWDIPGLRAVIGLAEIKLKSNVQVIGAHGNPFQVVARQLRKPSSG